jgi:predicted acylesterase/phospholipase RssA
LQGIASENLALTPKQLVERQVVWSNNVESHMDSGNGNGDGGKRKEPATANDVVLAAANAIVEVTRKVRDKGRAGTAIQAIHVLEEIGTSDRGSGARDALITKINEIVVDATGQTVSPASRPQAKRAICLGGGGPAAGLHIGVLDALEKQGVKFDQEDSVWALSCIGAWVGVVYNQAKEGHEIEQTYKFFKDIFRDNKIFESFPVNTIFSPDLMGDSAAFLSFLVNPKNYVNAIVPEAILKSLSQTLSAVSNVKNWGKLNQGDFNRWLLNDVMAVHPVVRFLSAMAYKSGVDGRTRLFYPESSFIKAIKFDELYKPNKPYIFYNAFNFTKQDVDLFGNKWPTGVNPRSQRKTARRNITAQSLCACSALPFIEQTVNVDGTVYCEGALVDTVNFRSLIEDHGDSLNEVWINRIVDSHQIRKPENLHDALANLCQLFAATVGEDDIKLFKLYARENNRSADRNDPKWEGTIIEVQVDDRIDFHWDERNLEAGIVNGGRKAEEALRLLDEYRRKPAKDGVLILPDDLTVEEIERVGVTVPVDMRPDRQ